MRAPLGIFAVTFAALGFLSPVHGQEHGAKGHGAKNVSIVNAWARATPKGAKVGAAYFEIKTAAGGADRLVGAKSDAAGKVELHTHIHDDGVMRMRKISGVDVKANSSHLFKPSGDHLMLMDLKAPIEVGGKLKITLQFEKAGEIEVDAKIEPIGAPGPHGSDKKGDEAMDHSKHGAPEKPQEHKH